MRRRRAADENTAAQYPRYGYRTHPDLLERQGHVLGVDRMYRLWRQEGLQVPRASAPRRVADQSTTTVAADGDQSRVGYDFVFDTCADGQQPEMPHGHRRVHAGVSRD